MGEHHRTLFLNMFVEDDFLLAMPQKPGECPASGEKWPLAQILTVVLKEIEAEVEEKECGAGKAEITK